ncbi:MAG: DUF2933 domain-containing protein [Actinomycetota bacterium]|nr:DUF2933 domain-containing protein [Actinomycetota bacterium]
MNMSMKHVAGTAAVGALVVVVLVWAGLPLATVLPFAFILACPLMMIVMMVMMGGHGMDSSSDHHVDDRDSTNR